MLPQVRSRRRGDREKAEARQNKLIAAQFAQAEADLAKKRKREETEREREAAKAQKMSEQLRRVEELRARRSGEG